MMVRRKLGTDWRDALKHHVLAPLRMTRTSARLEDFRPGEAAHCHTRGAPGGAWDALPLKPTLLLNAAGGIYSSGNDTIRYLKAFTSRGRSAAGRIPAESLARTGEVFADQDRDTWGFHRSHYGLGWDIGTYGRARMWLRAGAFDGCRAMFVVYPDADLAIGLLTVSDIGANGYNAAIARQAFDLWTGDPAATANAGRRVAEFARDAAAAVRESSRAGEAAIAEVTMSAEALAAYAGRYASDRLGVFTLVPANGRLRAAMGAFTPMLVPTGKDAFHSLPFGGAPGEPYTFVRDSDGRITRMRWGEREFDRLP
jgi:CubicO group peptidase (beta-lactamase class C family)